MAKIDRQRFMRQRSKLIQQQAPIAIDRDGGLCTICYFVHNRLRSYHEVHHVYGRARSEDTLWREMAINLLCTCKECHPPAIFQPGASANLGYIEDVRIKANETPLKFINTFGEI